MLPLSCNVLCVARIFSRTTMTVSSPLEIGKFSEDLCRAIKPIPFKGIPEFFDISGLLSDPILFQKVIDSLCIEVQSRNPTVICALDARGFLLGAPVALQLRVPLVMIRKQGKLPGTCVVTKFDKEYESGDAFEMQCGAVKPGDRVVVIDDVLATGGSMNGAFSLIRQFTPESIVGVCVMDLGLPGSQEYLAKHDLCIVSLLDVSKWKRCQ